MAAIGRVSSIQSLGTVDGPGVRFVAFLQGCNLRCGCCHNPETQSFEGGEEYSPERLFNKAARFREYFGTAGGVTLSGGEPLMQAEFAREYFSLCKAAGINTCLDTSGSILNQSVLSLLDVTDRVLLDIKYTNDEQYLEYVGCSIKKPLEFLAALEHKKIPTVIRQVIVPTLNDDAQSIYKLKELNEKYSCIEKIELLPFKKLCIAKYESLGREFPFAKYETPTAESINSLEQLYLT